MTDAPDLEPAALEAAWLAHDNAYPGEHWKKRERMAVAIRAYLSARSAPEAGKAVDPVGWRYRGYFYNRPLPWQMTDQQWLADRQREAGEEVEPLFLASSPAPTGATESCGCVFRDLNVPCRNWECEICHDLASPQPVAPTGEIAGLIERLDSHMGMQDVSILLRDCRLAAAALTASEAEAADLRRKLEEHQDAEDKAAREMATVIQGLRNRATAAERKLEEARKALRRIANHTSMLDELENCMEMRRIAARALSTQVEERE